MIRSIAVNTFAMSILMRRIMGFAQVTAAALTIDPRNKKFGMVSTMQPVVAIHIVVNTGIKIMIISSHHVLQYLAGSWKPAMTS
jgi:hypothetical protein